MHPCSMCLAPAVRFLSAAGSPYSGGGVQDFPGLLATVSSLNSIGTGDASSNQVANRSLWNICVRSYGLCGMQECQADEVTVLGYLCLCNNSVREIHQQLLQASQGSLSCLRPPGVCPAAAQCLLDSNLLPV
eukprot:scpid102107/ scgid17873/ 